MTRQQSGARRHQIVIRLSSATLILGVAACGATTVSPSPSAMPPVARTPTVSPTASPSESPEAEPITLADLDATLAYAICADGQCDVHVLDARGVDRNVTDTPEPGTEDHQPVFSPDGTRVTFRCSHEPGRERENNANDDLCAIDVDGSEFRNLTDNAVADYSSSWSPDGRLIAFSSGREGAPDNPNDIYIMDADGRGVRRVTDSVGIDEYPVWSPGGKTIAFSCTDGEMHTSGVGNFEVCVVNADGSGRKRLTETPGICDPTDWSPDGQTLALMCDLDGNGDAPHEVYVLDGGGWRQLTTTGGYGAQFVPDASALIYNDRDGDLWQITLSGVRSDLDVPLVEGTWDLWFNGS